MSYRKFPVDPQRVLKLYREGNTLEQIADRFVGMSASEMRQALDYALGPKEEDLTPQPIPENLPRCPDSDLHVTQTYELANADKPGFGNSIRDLRQACDKSIVEVFEAFHNEGKIWNGLTNISYLRAWDVRESMGRRSRMDLWEKVNPGNRLGVRAYKPQRGFAAKQKALSEAEGVSL